MLLRDLHEGIRLSGLQAPLKIGDKTNVSIIRNGDFEIRDSDYPDDLIVFEPFYTAKKLRNIPADLKSLSSFEEAESKIYYGFALRPASQVSDQQVDQLRERHKLASGFVTTDSLLNAVTTAIEVGVKEISQLKCTLVELKYQERNSVEGSSRQSEIRRKFDAVAMVLDFVATNDISQTLPEIKLDLADNSRTSGANVRQYMKDAVIAINKAIKHPKKQSEQALRDYIIKKSIEHLTRINNRHYDYVVYPESSSGFNKILGSELAKAYGCKHTEIPKIPAKFDKDELELRAMKMQAAGRGKAINTSNGIIKPSDKSWPDEWAKKEMRKLGKYMQQGGQIKNAPQDKRRYVINFDMPSDIETGSAILMVDDNVDGGGTMERLHAIMSTSKPTVIDIFTPFYMAVT